MAAFGAIDLFSGQVPITGTNLFQVNKNPLNQLDEGLQDVIGKQARGASNQFLQLLEELIGQILGIPLAELLKDLANLPNVFDQLSPLNWPYLGQYFRDIESFVGVGVGLFGTVDFQAQTVVHDFVTGQLKPTELLAFLVQDASTSAGLPGLYVPIENIAMDIIGETLGSAQAVIDAILGSIGFPPGSGTANEVNQMFNDLMSMLANPPLTSEGFNAQLAVADFIKVMMWPTGLVAGLAEDATIKLGLKGFIPMENLAINLINEAVGGGQAIIDSILSTVGFPPGVGTPAEVQTYFSQLLQMLGFPPLTSGLFHPDTAVQNFITTMLIPQGLLAPLDASGFIPQINLPNLDTSKITSGVFANSFVPGLAQIHNAVANSQGGPPSGNTLTTMQYWLTQIPGVNIVTPILATIVPALDATKIATGQFAQSMVTNLVSDLGTALGGVEAGSTQQIITAITDLPAGTITDLTNYINSLESILGTTSSALLTIPFNSVNAVINFINTMLAPTNLLAPLAPLGAGFAVPAINIPGLDASKITSGIFSPPQIPGLDASKIISGIFGQWSLPNLSVGQIGNFLPNLLSNATYATGASVNAGGMWSWISSISHTADGSGAVQAIANGTLGQLFSDPPCFVSVGQTLTCSHWIQWTGCTGTGTCFKLSLACYLLGVLQSVVDLASIGGPLLAGSRGTASWQQMSGTYTVPAGVDSVRLLLQVMPSVTAGTIQWDDGSITKTGLFSTDWTAGLTGTLSNINTQMIARMLQTDAIALVNALGLGSFTDIPSSITPITNRLQGISAGGILSAGYVAGLDASKIISGLLSPGLIPSLPAGWAGTLDASLVSGTTAAQTELQSAMVTTLGGIPSLIGSDINAVQTVLNAVPLPNVTGPPTWGMGNALSSIQGFANTLYDGLVGNPSGLAARSGDIAPPAISYGQANAVSTLDSAHSIATQANNNLIARSGQKAISAGIDPTGDSVFNFAALTGTTTPTITLTNNVPACGIIATPDGGIKESIRWFGGNATGTISGFYLNIYSISTTTGAQTLMYASPDIHASISTGPTLVWNSYNLPSASYVTTQPGHYYVAEMIMVGTGAYSVAGVQHQVTPQPGVFPAGQMALTRNLSTSGGIAPATLPPPSSSGPVQYSSSIPYLQLSGSPGTPQYSAVSAAYLSAGTYHFQIPPWMVTLGTGKVDIAMVGAGGSGSCPSNGWYQTYTQSPTYQGFVWDPIYGENINEQHFYLMFYAWGGGAGQWNSVTLNYGTDIPAGTTQLTVVVGAGGVGVGGVPQAGSAGGSSYVQVPTWGQITAPGGAAGYPGNGSSTNWTGLGAGNYTMPTGLGESFVGGAAQGNTLTAGNPPGGGGTSGQTYYIQQLPPGPYGWQQYLQNVYPSPAGADGAAWLTAYPSS